MYRKKSKDPDRHQKGICLMYIMYNWICSRIFTESWFTKGSCNFLCTWRKWQFGNFLTGGDAMMATAV